MKQTAWAALLVLINGAAPGAGAPRGLNYLRNGGFEAGDFRFWTEQAPFTEVLAQPFDGVVPRHGGHYALLGPRGVEGRLAQSFQDRSGQALRIGFWLKGDGALPNNFAALWNGATMLALADVAAGGWRRYTLDVVATGNDTISFNFRDDTGYLALDGVTVTNDTASLHGVRDPLQARLRN